MAGITELNFIYDSFAGGRVRNDLKSGDFAGLTGLTHLKLNTHQLTTLPADIFSGLSALTELRLQDNQLSTLPTGIFSGLTALTILYLSGNPLTSLPTGIFDDLPSTVTKTLPDGVTINAAVPTTVGTISDITYLVANGSPRTVDVADKFSDTNDTLTFSASSDDTNIATATITLIGSGVTVTPLAVDRTDRVVSATITVTATDSAGQTATQTFTVSVINPAPRSQGTIANITDLVANGSPQAVNVASNFSDTDTLTFSARSNDINIATVGVANDSEVTVTPVAAGTTTITVTATDIAGQTAEQTFSVAVQAEEVTTGTAGVKNIGVSVSPNPIKDGDRITITVAGDGVYRLFGSSGEFLTKGTLTKGDNTVAFPFLAKGIYLLKIQTTHGRVTRKVVKN